MGNASDALRANEDALMMSGSPDAINARLLREMWDDWEINGSPYHQLAQNTVLDPEIRQQLDENALNNSMQASDQAFERTENRIKTLSSRLPQDTDPQMQQSRDRQINLAKGASRVNAFNQTQQALGDRELGRLVG